MPNCNTLYPYSTGQTPIRTVDSPALVYDINSKFELLNFCMCLTFSLVWKLISDESPCSKNHTISQQYWALHCSCQYLSPFCFVTLYLINCYLIMYHQSAPELHYPLFLPILFDLYLLFAKCRIMATLIKNFLWGIYWIILPSTWRRALSSLC